MKILDPKMKISDTKIKLLLESLHSGLGLERRLALGRKLAVGEGLQVANWASTRSTLRRGPRIC
eukprot:2223632-Karenia_brevis.AAC.1